MRLAHILVCHSTDPTKAVESIPHETGVLWYVFLHSLNRDVEFRVERLMASREGNIFTYRFNRGLARSWNDGLHLALEAGCDAALLLNDDLFFRDNAYDEFVRTIAAVKKISNNVSYITPLGLETGTSAHAGQILPQQFACCAIMPETIDRIGYFDENFTPAYYEDFDFDRRARLAGMTVHVHQQVLVEHERSATHRSMSAQERSIADAQFAENRIYFENKWGPDTTWTFPFNETSIGLGISFSNRQRPYGKFDRDILRQSSCGASLVDRT